MHVQYQPGPDRTRRRVDRPAWSSAPSAGAQPVGG